MSYIGRTNINKKYTQPIKEYRTSPSILFLFNAKEREKLKRRVPEREKERERDVFLFRVFLLYRYLISVLKIAIYIT